MCRLYLNYIRYSKPQGPKPYFQLMSKFKCSHSNRLYCSWVSPGQLCWFRKLKNQSLAKFATRVCAAGIQRQSHSAALRLALLVQLHWQAAVWQRTSLAMHITWGPSSVRECEQISWQRFTVWSRSCMLTRGGVSMAACLMLLRKIPGAREICARSVCQKDYHLTV